MSTFHPLEVVDRDCNSRLQLKARGECKYTEIYRFSIAYGNEVSVSNMTTYII